MIEKFPATNENQPVSDRLATESGFRRLRSRARSVEKAIHPDQRFEEVAPQLRELHREATVVADYLFNEQRRLSRSSSDRALVGRMYDLCSRLAGNLGNILYFRDNPEEDTRPEAERKYMFEALHSELADLRRAVLAVPIESPFNKWRMLRSLRKLGVAAGLFAGGFALSDSPSVAEQDDARSRTFQADAGAEKNIQEQEGKDYSLDQAQKESSSADLNESAADTKAEGVEGNPLLESGSSESMPDMSSAGTEPGKFELGEKIGTIETPFNTSIDSSLWVIRMKDRTASGALCPATRTFYSKMAEEPAATLHLSLDVQRGAVIHLPAPVNHVAYIDDARLREGDIFDIYSQTLTVGSAFHGELPVKIYYEPEVNSRNVSAIFAERTSEGEAAVVALRGADPDEVPGILDNHLREFHYVNSSDMQALFEMIPGRFDEKMQRLRMGDCDMLATYAAGLMHSAGKTAQISSGLLETDGALWSERRHAQLVFGNGDEKELVQNGHLLHYEATRAVQSNFVNLKLLAQDMQHLEGLAKAMPRFATSGELAPYLDDFREEFLRIINQEHYKQFENKGGAGEEQNVLRSLGNALKTLETQFSVEGLHNMDLKDPSFYVLAVLTIISGLLAAKGLSKVADKIESYQERARVARLKQMAEFLNQIEEIGGESSARMSAALEGRIRDVYAHFPQENLEEAFPLKEVLTWPAEKKRAYLTLVGLMRIALGSDHPPVFIGPLFVKQVLESRRLAVLIDRADSEGAKIGDLISSLRAHLLDPEKTQKLRDAVPALIEERIRAGIAIAEKASVVAPTDKNVRQSLAHFFEIREDEQGAATASRGRKHASSDGDFREHRAYNPGDDARLIDQQLLARTGKLHVKQFEQVRGVEQSLHSIAVVIDVSSMSREDVEKMAGFFMYAGRFSQKIGINSITFTAFGNVLERMEGRVTRGLQQTAQGIALARHVLARFFELAIPNVPVERTITNQKVRAERLHGANIPVSIETDKIAGRGGEVFVFGRPSLVEVPGVRVSRFEPKKADKAA